MAKQLSWLMTYAPTDPLPGQQELNLTYCDPWEQNDESATKPQIRWTAPQRVVRRWGSWCFEITWHYFGRARALFCQPY